MGYEALRLMTVRDEASDSDLPSLKSSSSDEKSKRRSKRIFKWIECEEVKPEETEETAEAEGTEPEGTECVDYGFTIPDALPFLLRDLRRVRVGVSSEGEILEVVLRGAVRSG